MDRGDTICSFHHSLYGGGIKTKKKKNNCIYDDALFSCKLSSILNIFWGILMIFFFKFQASSLVQIQICIIV